jgi:tetratricopeptide (TPR) repeat protein
MRRFPGLCAIVLAAATAATAPAAADDPDITMSQIYLMAGDLVQARESIDEVIADEPDYAPAYLVSASVWQQSGDFDKAADDYSQAIAHGLDHSPYVYTARGHTRFSAQHYGQAVADYGQALAINPGFWPAIVGRGMALAESGDAVRALADLDRALAHDPGDITETLKSEHVQVQSRKGPPQQGTNTLSATVASAPLMLGGYFERGKLHIHRGAYKPALADLDEVLKRAPGTGPAHFYRGVALLGLGRCREGEAEIRGPGLAVAPKLRAELTQHKDAVAKAGCSVEKL